MNIIYHNQDLDGYCSGAIAKLKYPEGKLIGYNYGDPFPLDQLIPGTPIIMMDVSMPMEQMLQLAKISKNQFTWIDHHATAIADYEAMVSELDEHQGVPFKTVLQTGIAACELTWNYLFPNEKMPKAVEFLGKYDTWREYDTAIWWNVILPFQYGMRIKCNSPETFRAELLDKDPNVTQTIIAICMDGQNILDYQTTQNKRTCKEAAFESSLFGFGLNAICLNASLHNSTVFESVYDPKKHDIMFAFQYQKGVWKCSLYTTHDRVHCGELAQIYGGGGHAKAAGFKIKSIQGLLNI
jgi:uncharacterized protein